MTRPLIALAVLCLISCSVGLELPDDARVVCDSSASCPSGYECVASLGYCVPRNTQLQEVEVSFTLPREGDEEVGLTSTAVVVLNMNTTLPDTHEVTLVSDNGADNVPIVITAPGASNTLIITPQKRLFPLTRYALTVLPGIAPAEGLLATASTATWTAHFTTTASTDLDPPEPITKLVIYENTDAYKLEWTGSISADTIGAIVLRNNGSPVADVPANGKSYVSGQSIGAATVASVGVAPSATDPVSAPGLWYYSVFAFDSALNYSTGVQPPRAALAGLLWCPTEIGTASVTSSDPGAAELLIGASVSPTLADGTLFPATGAVAFGSTISFQGAGVAAGAVNRIRPVAIAGEATFVGALTSVYWPHGQLTVGIPVKTPIGGVATTTFQPDQWPAFKAQVDTNAATNIEAYGAPASLTGNTVSATMSARGNFRFRVAPVVTGCGTDVWSQSGQFQVGDPTDIYVSAGATGDGFSASSPAGDFTSVVTNNASNGTTVHVAAGAYSGLFPLKDGVTYLGSYKSDFSTRSVTSYASTVDGGSSAVISSPTLTNATIVDGFYMKSSTTGAGVINLQGSPGLLTLSGNRIENTGTSTTTGVVGIYSTSGSPLITGNTIKAEQAISINAGSSIVIEDNVISGSQWQRAAVHCYGGSPIIRGNSIENILTKSGYTGAAVTVQNPCTAQIVENRITSHSTQTDSTTTGIFMLSGSANIFDNIIHGGYGGTSIGLLFYDAAGTSTDTVLVSNNTIHAGAGGTVGSYSHTRTGIAFKDLDQFGSYSTSATWTLRVTNNLIVGDGDMQGFYYESGYSGVKSIENNVVVIADSSDTRFYTSVTSGGTAVAKNPASAQTESCAAFWMSGNAALVSTAATTLFASAGGTDGDVTTLGDNNWSLATSNATVVTGGLTLSASPALNCGGTPSGGVCSASAKNATCGGVTTDFAGAARTPSYSVGAYEK